MVYQYEITMRRKPIECMENYEPQTNTPNDVYRMLRKYGLCNRPQEQGVVIMLNVKNEVIGIDTVTTGCINATHMSPREIYVRAIKRGAASIIIAHNHPSGDTTPSGEDISTTKRLQQAGEILCISLLDHIIVSMDGYTSMRQDGYIQR